MRIVLAFAVALVAAQALFDVTKIGPQVGIPIGSFGPITLTPYQALATNDLVTIPVLTPPGQYRVALVVDPARSFVEPDENNNMILARASI